MNPIFFGISSLPPIFLENRHFRAYKLLLYCCCTIVFKISVFNFCVIFEFLDDFLKTMSEKYMKDIPVINLSLLMSKNINIGNIFSYSSVQRNLPGLISWYFLQKSCFLTKSVKKLWSFEKKINLKNKRQIPRNKNMSLC